MPNVCLDMKLLTKDYKGVQTAKKKKTQVPT